MTPARWKRGRQTLDEAKCLGSVSGSDPDDYLLDGMIYTLENLERVRAEDAKERERLKVLGLLRDDLALEEMPPE